jgi:hypothetical protein
MPGEKREVAMVFPGRGICSRIFPDGLADFLHDCYRQKGVEIPEWCGGESARQSLAGLAARRAQIFER